MFCIQTRYLIKFLARLDEYQDSNKMTPGNMAIVLGPNLLWTHTEPSVSRCVTLNLCLVITSWLYRNGNFSLFFLFFSRNMTEMMTTLSLQIVGVVEPIIQHADWFFPGGGLRCLHYETVS